MVWENVKNALSIGKPAGADFQAVLTEICKIAQPSSPDVPLPDKWPHAGILYGVGANGNAFSVAWRLHNAQYWGVPQRRERVCVLADFNGTTAGEILFDPEYRVEADGTGGIEAVSNPGGEPRPEVHPLRKGVSWDSKPGEAAREGTAGTVGEGTDRAEPICLIGNCIDRADTAGCNGSGYREGVSFTINTVDRHGVMVLNDQGGNRMDITEDMTCTLRAEAHHPPVVAFAQNQRDEVRDLGDVAGALQAEPGMKQQTFLFENHRNDARYNGPLPVSPTLQAKMGEGGNNTPLVLSEEVSVFDARGNGNGKTVPTLTGDHEGHVSDYTALCVGNWQTNQSVGEISGALNAMHDQQAVMCFQNTGKGWWNESEVGATIRTPCGGDSTKANLVVVEKTYMQERFGEYRESDTSSTLRTSGTFGTGSEDVCVAVDCRNGKESETNGTLQAKANGGLYLNTNNVCRQAGTARRLTPMEAERLQNFPDDWTDIGDWVDSKGRTRKSADTLRYKALGNSIALPFWHWLLKRISAQYERTPTLGSLFDGIGGFPLCWERINGRGTAKWSSEIEEFCIAVVKKHFGDEETGIEGDITKYL